MDAQARRQELALDLFAHDEVRRPDADPELEAAVDAIVISQADESSRATSRRDTRPQAWSSSRVVPANYARR
jgi:hypothetical protein